jgi:hypothetical protein
VPLPEPNIRNKFARDKKDRVLARVMYIETAGSHLEQEGIALLSSQAILTYAITGAIPSIKEYSGSVQ